MCVRRASRSTWPLTLAMASVACGDGAESGRGDTWTAVVDTVADTVTVRTVSGSAWGDTATLVPEVSIGVVDGADAYLLGDPSAMAVTADGTILLLDAQVPVLRRYDPEGTDYRVDLYRQGRQALRLTPLELLERLARLVPPPRLHRHRYHGVLAPNARLRSTVVSIGRPVLDEIPVDTNKSTLLSEDFWDVVQLRQRSFESGPLFRRSVEPIRHRGFS